MAFDSSILEKIRDRIRISEVISKRVKLERKGREYLGLCPFHNERTPSFTVNDEKQFYHCFGCGAHGDIINFVMQTTGDDYSSTVQNLANQLGIEIPKPDPKLHDKNMRLYYIMDLAKKWFETQLKINPKVAQYLSKRGVTQELIAKFSIGYASDQKNSLINHLLSCKINEEEMLEVGLIVKGEKGSYDRFRARIMFPIINSNGNVIAFGGRTMDNDVQPKYLNSPETAIFKKRETLFAENIAKSAAYKNKRLIVVEGYMDVISMNKVGLSETVASLGTAVSDLHLKKLWRYCDEPIFCLDGDQAGLKAMNRVAHEAIKLLDSDHSLSFVKLPTGMDPDDIANKEGKKAIEELLKQKHSLSEFIWSYEFSSLPDNATPEQKSSLEKNLFAIAASIKDNVIKSAYRNFFANKLWENVKRSNKSKKTNDIISNKSALTSIANCVISDIEKVQRTLIMIIITCPELLNKQDILEDFANLDLINEELENLRTKILDIYDKNNYISGNDLEVDLKNDFIFRELINWSGMNIAKIQYPFNISWEYSFLKHQIMILEIEYKDSLAQLDEKNMIKAGEIRKNIIQHQNRMMQIEHLLDH